MTALCIAPIVTWALVLTPVPPNDVTCFTEYWSCQYAMSAANAAFEMDRQEHHAGNAHRAECIKQPADPNDKTDGGASMWEVPEK